jgi:DNA modification methylase
MGSGTTGRVCDKLERSFVGYDLIGISIDIIY